MREALRSGLDYVRTAPVARCVLVRTATFSVGASALLALLPIIARPHGATGYGLLLGCFGLGALAGAAVLPRLKLRMSVDGVVAFAIILFAVTTFLAGNDGSFVWLLAILFVSGAAWIGILACLNVAAQTMSPPYLRARALSMYILVLQGGMALGSAAWGALASWQGIPVAMSWSAMALVAGLLAVKRYPLTAAQLHLAPAVVRD
jgi:MFS family permease